MRILGGIALLVSVTLVGLSVWGPNVAELLSDPGDRPIVIALAAVLVGACGLAFAAIVLRLRLAQLVDAAERLAAGELDVQVGTRGAGLERRLAVAINGISSSIAAKHDQATVDRLTGVANRQALLAALFNEVDRASRYDRPLSVAFMDIDHFKAVNDTYGHAAGDVVLRGVAQAVKANLRGTDLIGRYGGEEFMLLLTETSVDDAAVLAEKLRSLVARLQFPVDGNPALAVTISIGIAGGVGKSLRTDELVRDADAAMYSAKSLGRNQTYIFAEPSDDARVPRAPISAAGRSRAQQIGNLARVAAEQALAEVIAPLAGHRGGPSAVVASIVTAMASQLDLPEADAERLRVAALLHDIGKVALPEEVLEKPTALTSAEWRMVVQHPRIGQVILEQASAFRDAAPIILHHHERYAGHGYPFGLHGNEIPLGARILAIADAYGAMTSDRPYRRAFSHDQAIKEIRRLGGTQFDPELVALFCDLFADAAPSPDASVEALLASRPGPGRAGPGRSGERRGRRTPGRAGASHDGVPGSAAG